MSNKSQYICYQRPHLAITFLSCYKISTLFLHGIFHTKCLEDSSELIEPNNAVHIKFVYVVGVSLCRYTSTEAFALNRLEQSLELIELCSRNKVSLVHVYHNNESI